MVRLMGELYSPAKIRLVAARGNQKSSLSVKLCEAVIRADVYQWFDVRTNTVHFYSMNKDAPLTDEEKKTDYEQLRKLYVSDQSDFRKLRYTYEQTIHSSANDILAYRS